MHTFRLLKLKGEHLGELGADWSISLKLDSSDSTLSPVTGSFRHSGSYYLGSTQARISFTIWASNNLPQNNLYYGVSYYLRYIFLYIKRNKERKKEKQKATSNERKKGPGHVGFVVFKEAQRLVFLEHTVSPANFHFKNCSALI
jgi:hypothetical protein